MRLGPLRLMMHQRFSSPSVVFNAGAAVVGLSLHPKNPKGAKWDPRKFEIL
jgi:hypothetical protein